MTAPVAGATLDALLKARAASKSGKPCIKTADGRQQWTYAELDGAASSVAAALRGHGCQPGERIALALGNTPGFFGALFGCLRLGAIAVPVDASLAPPELAALADHAAPTAVIGEDIEAMWLADVPADQAQWQQLWDGARTRHRIGAFRETRNHAKSATAARPADPALLLYTSGTTGSPKAVAYSHATLLTKLDAVQRCLGADDSLISLCLLPTHFGHGLICNCLSTFYYGGTLVIAPPFNLDLLQALPSIIRRERVGTFSTVPTVVRLLLRHAARRDTTGDSSSLRLVTCASAPLWPEEVAQFEGTFGVPLLNCYGLTETAGWSVCSPNDPQRDRASVGKPIDCEVRVVDREGRPLPPSTRGEVQIKGPCVMPGYYRCPASEQPLTDDGWLATGDIGELDDSGALFFHSRTKELIIRAGKNIAPAEVDRALMSHPDVVEAYAVGLDDPLLGETVGACVVRRPDSSLDETELMAHARRHLAAYKCPQRVRFVDRIPKTARGKVRRPALRELFPD